MQRVIPTLLTAVLILAVAQRMAFGESLRSPSDRDPCPGATLYYHAAESSWDLSSWQNEAVVPPDFGSVAEGYAGVSGYVCGIRLVFARLAQMDGTGLIDAYVWDYDPATHNPGAVISLVASYPVSGVPEVPSKMIVDLPVPESFVGSNGFFVGYWPRHAVFGPAHFGILMDFESPGDPRTKYAPGLGYPPGWGTWDVAGYPYTAAGAGGYVSESPTPARESSWGAIKNLYR